MERGDGVRRVVGEALGQSDAFLDFQERLSQVACVDRPVLIVGERGTGKELAASRVHYLSVRWQGPLVVLNCSALPESLIESELFGHEAGAFTGATKERRGRFEAADGGTLFLDEIALIPVVVQEKILRVVEYGTFERVGSSKAVSVDVRIVGATNADLPALVREGRFKQDLLDRLSFEVLRLPPLRERTGDIMLIARHFAARMALEMGLPDVPEFSAEATAELERYEWPGNVRQLKNVVERTVYRSGGETVQEIETDPFGTAGEAVTERQPDEGLPAGRGADFVPGRTTLPQALQELEIHAVRSALRQTRYHQGKAARLLGLTYDQFRRLYRKHKAVLTE
jgi:psp operon transcriptional activator